MILWCIGGSATNRFGSSLPDFFGDTVLASSFAPDETTSHSTKLSEDDSKVAGYSRAVSTACVAHSLPPCLTFRIRSVPSKWNQEYEIR